MTSKVKICKDCKYYRNSNWSHAYCERVTSVKLSPVIGQIERSAGRSCGIERSRWSWLWQGCGVNAKFWEKKS